jgi:uncharacterized protein
MNRIISELLEIEEQHGVKILYAVEAGSRAWGYASDRSDYDIRFIYVHPVRHYLSLQPTKDVIEKKIDDQFEIIGWDLKKALWLLHQSNPSIHEWLTNENIYIQHNAVKKIRLLCEKGFSPYKVTNHYYRMAKKNMEFVSSQSLLAVKKYLNVIRPILSCLWIEKFQSFPPNKICIMWSKLDLNEAFKGDIGKILLLKKEGKNEVALKRFPSLLDEINHEILRIEIHLENSYRKKQADIEEFNEVFHHILEEIWAGEGGSSIN